MARNQQLKVLLVEDDKGIRDSLEELLVFEDYLVKGACDGREGLVLVKDWKPDIIISDIMMPGMDGWEFLKGLRNQNDFFLTPFVFLTARGEKKDILAGFGLGADDYLPKPFTRDQLLTCLVRQREKLAIRKKLEERRLNTVRLEISSKLPHELLTPLNAILGFADLIAQDGNKIEDGALKEMASTIRDSGNTLLNTIHRFLFYARLQLSLGATRQENQTPVDAARILESTAQKTAAVFNREADLEIEAEALQVRINKDHFYQAVFQLTENAFKFSPGGTKVKIQLRADGSEALLTVDDQGRGMSQEQIKEIDAFHQFDRKLFEQQGAGLGLAIVKLLALHVQGTFGLETRESGGLRAFFRFPLT